MSAVRRAWDALDLARHYMTSSKPSRAVEPLFDDVEAYCMFIGYPRSGHSLVGGLLDAHPEAVVAHELGALKFIRARFDRRRLLYLLRENARVAAGRDRPSGDYRYDVPGQWQGGHGRIRVIGDKKAEGATLRLRAKPVLLDRLQSTVGVPIRIVHVVRNPFDNISTMAIRAANGGTPDLAAATSRYFALCRTVERIKARLDREALFEQRHEALLEAPADELGALCRWLGLTPGPDYLGACAGIVWSNPRKSREKVEWTPDLRSEVERRMAEHSHLDGYAFHA